MALADRQFTFLSALTAIVVLGYVLASGYALARSIITWTDFSGAVGPIAGLLLGYWIRGQNDPKG